VRQTGKTEERSCWSKQRYETAAQARRARSRLIYGKELGVYTCRFCGGAHLAGRVSSRRRKNYRRGRRGYKRRHV